MMALTATATARVRTDIITQLKLRAPACYVASFDRPNLTYRVFAKSKPYEQLLQFLRGRPRDSGIVYCQARKTAERLADRLSEDGVKAKPYHAGLTGNERTQHQELFLRDEVRVICATIAFGMGINKPNVRFVVHYDLPKNIEGYYQETGRAGRDGLPSDCVLLFSAGDVVKQSKFIAEKPLQEQKVAREQLQQMVHYAESAICRRRELLRYFSESYAEENCEGCDNCLAPRDTYDGTLTAQKLLSCIYRVRQQSGFDFGLNQYVEVLTGADTDNVRKWNHARVSTYGIGQEHTRPEWKEIGRQLIRLGYVRQAPDKFNVLSLTPEGIDLLKQRKRVTLTRPVTAPEPVAHRVGEIACDEALFEQLRQLRKQLADERGVPSYIVFSDVSLRQMARNYPATEREFASISGIGERKLHEFGKVFLAEIAAHLQTNPRQIFADDSFAAPAPVPNRVRLGDTARETLRLFRAGRSVPDIAAWRRLSIGTIYGHLADALQVGESLDLNQFLTLEDQHEIAAAFRKNGFQSLSLVLEALGGRYDYGRLKLMRAVLMSPKKPFG
jgi:ATP-dependent DNA helicase RecQ